MNQKSFQIIPFIPVRSFSKFRALTGNSINGSIVLLNTINIVINNITICNSQNEVRIDYEAIAVLEADTGLKHFQKSAIVRTAPCFTEQTTNICMCFKAYSRKIDLM